MIAAKDSMVRRSIVDWSKTDWRKVVAVARPGLAFDADRLKATGPMGSNILTSVGNEDAAERYGGNMKLIFGTALDGRSYPDFTGGADGWINTAAVGPRGLVQALELQLGLTGPSVSDAVRIASYLNKLERTAAQDPGVFFAASFLQDPWATAKTVLSWRDQLVAAGWRGVPCGEPRIDALAKAEASSPSLPSGLPDRAMALCAALELGAPITVEEIAIAEDRTLIDPCWCRLLDNLETRGVSVRELSTVDLTDPASDLGIAARFLSSGEVGQLRGDGSLLVLDADTELMAAEAVADWVAAGGEEGLIGTVIVSDGTDTALLDRALVSRGLPALGHSAASPWRGALQILPLAFAIAWRPFDPRALLDLLTLPQSPVGPSAARRLSRALVEEPGTGAGRWAAAWEAIEQDAVAREKEGAGGSTPAAARVQRWREWTVGGIHSRMDGMPVANVLEIASRVAAWATEADAGDGDELLMSLATAASAMAEAVTVLGQNVLSALLIERLIEQVLASGCRNPDHFATSGDLRGVDDPAAIWAPARTVIWWDFVGPGCRPQHDPWTASERAALHSVVGQLDLVVRHPTYGLGVIDLKWSRSPKRRVAELAEGRAIQLATYGAIAEPDGAGHAEGACYLLAQRRLVGLEGSMFREEEMKTARDLQTTWLDLVATWRHWRDAALSGRAVASGLPPEEPEDVAEVRFVAGREPCKYCEFTGLCRVAAVEV